MSLEGSLPGRVSARSRLAARLSEPAVAATLVLTGMLLLAAAVRVWLAGKVAAPWIMGDELLYAEEAKSFAADGELELREAAVASFYGIYPVLIAPAWKASSIETAYGLAKAINVVAMTLAVVPFFLWARRLVRPAYALVAAGLVLLLPSFTYSGTLMTENAAFPTFMLAFFAIALALERPTLWRQAGALAAIALACAFRLQGLVLFLVLVTAVALKLVFDLRHATGPRWPLVRAELRRYLPTAAVLLLLAVGYLAYKAVQGQGLSSGLGGYQAVAEVNYSAEAVARWTVFHLAEIGLAVGLIPASALLVLVGLACTRGFATTAGERAFLAVGVAATAWIVLQAGAFASYFSSRIEERNMFYVEPLLLLALVLWLERGLPRPPGLVLVGALAPAALLISLPLERFFNVSLLSDTFGLIPLLRLGDLLTGGADATRVLLALGAFAAGLFFALAPRRIVLVGAPAAVAVFLALSSYSVHGAVRDQARAARNAPQAVEADWVDEAIGTKEQAAIVFTPDFSADPHPIWQTEFWNRSVGPVYFLGASDPTGFPGHAATVDGRGRIVAPGVPTPRYVVAPAGLQIDGRPRARVGRFVLYDVKGPPRLASSFEGVYPDGWTGPEAAYNVYAAKPARTLRVDVGRPAMGGPDVPANVRIEAGALVAGAGGKADLGRVTDTKSWVVHSGQRRTVTLRVPKAPYRVEILVAPPFSPAQLGLGDTRQLGVHVAFHG